ncbi:MAG: hypothetical protein HY785_13600 [Oscillatoriophycideae cyanobacterium NC_groundwater_1537_Pr4_S-0.65um_50_18]|nr:hypothetical protein [Oscillatoriophycideae cyanobacterium NC_groundwater_1537_Pr4_S-0.65um_50_18]
MNGEYCTVLAREVLQAIVCYEQSLKIKRAIGDVHGEGQSLANLGLLHQL